MKKSISVILLVQNNESRIANSVREVMDIMSELATEFELLIIDDGSTDDSYVVMSELERAYPQISIARNQTPLGGLRAVQKGLENTDGEVIFVHDISVPFSQESLQGLWEMRDDEELVMARSRPKSTGTFPLLRRDREHAGAFGELQMIRRKAMLDLRGEPNENTQVTIDRVTRTDIKSDLSEVAEPKLTSSMRRIAYGD